MCVLCFVAILGTSDGYWTILETVPYSLQNTATNTAGTITNVSNSHLPVHNQSMHQQDEANSTEGNLITSATVVVEIPSESMGSAIKYTIPESEHQLIHTTESPQRMGASSSKQRIHIVKDMRLNPTMTVSQQSTMARCNVEHPNRQSSTQQHSQQHFTLNDCLSGGVVVQQSHTERQQSAQQQTEFIKIESIQDKMMLRNVIQYDSVAVASSSMDVLPSDTSQVIDAMVGNEKQQHHHLQIQPSHAEVLRNTRQIELLDKATIQAVSGTVLDAFDQQIQERDGDDKSHNSDMDDKLVSLMRCPTKIVTSTAAESGIQLQYVCNLCGKSYKIKGSLKRHKRYECGVAPTVACNFCPHKCKYKSDLRKHVTQKHSGQNSEEHLMDH